MDLSIVLSNLGSLFLGITIAIAVLFKLAAQHAETESMETCLGVVVCLVGGSITVLCYVAAVNLQV
jgi:hypothetical protein